MSDAAPGPFHTPANYQRTTGGHLSWQPPAPEHLQEMLTAYEILTILGHGGMGAVYKGRQRSLDRFVAIKILPPEAAEDDMQFAERFKNEARTMARMNHPSIVQVYDFGETSEGQLYIVMEFIDGTDVAQMIKSHGKLPEDYALAITSHLCDALGYAHTHGIVHRDIKPANVLINREGHVKVADFGLAKATDPSQMGLTKTNVAMGTPDFVSPEALIPGMPLDGRADLYAVGVMLYNMLTGTIPRGAFRMPSATLQTDARFDQIIGKAMEMDRERRYQTALDLRRDLDLILSTPAAKTGVQTIPSQQAALPQKPIGKSPSAPQQRNEGINGTSARAVPTADKSGRVLVRGAKKSSTTGIIYSAAAAVAIIAGAAILFSGGEKNTAEVPKTVAKRNSEATGPETKPTVLLPATSTLKPAPASAAVAAGKEGSAILNSTGSVSALASAKPTDVLTFGGHRYQLVMEQVKWDEAKAKAEAMGGHLATLSTKEEHEQLEAMLLPRFKQSGPKDGTNFWLGGQRKSASVGWKWITGESFTFTAWRTGSSDDGDKSDLVMQCMPREGNGKLGWDDVVKGYQIPAFLVEWDSDAPAAASPVASASPAAAPAPPSASPMSAAVTTPAAAPADPRLTQLAAGFKARYDADARQPFATALASLNKSYTVNGLARARAAAQAKGSLAEVTALDAEKTSIEKGLGVPVEDAADTPESLKTLRATYRTALAKHTTERDAKAAPLYDLYLNALDAYIAELTKADKIDDAQKVLAFRDGIASQKPATAAKPVVEKRAPAAAATEPSAAKPKTGTNAAVRAAVEWIIAHGGNVDLQGRKTIRKVEEIPSGPLSVENVGLYLKAPVPEADVHLLRALSGIKNMGISGWDLTDSGFAFLDAFGDLDSLNFRACPKITDALLEALPPMPNLGRLTLAYCQGITGTGLAQLKAPKLNSVDLSGNPVTDEGLAILSRHEGIKSLVLEGPAITDAGAAHLEHLRGLTTLRLSGTSVTPAGLTFLSKRKELTHLDYLDASLPGYVATAQAIATIVPNLPELTVRGKASGPEAVRALTVFKKLRSLNWQGSQLGDNAFAELAALKDLDYLNCGGGHLTDASIDTVLGLKRLSFLGLSDNADLTDAGLLKLKALRTLRDVHFSRSKATEAGAAELQKALPGIQVYR